MFRKGWWGTIYCTRCAVLLGRRGDFKRGWCGAVWYTRCAVGEGGGIQKSWCSNALPGVQCCRGGEEGVFHKGKCGTV